MRPLPKSLQKVMADHPEQFDEGWTEQDGWSFGGSWSHWLYLKKGWINPLEGVHMIHEATVKEVMERVRALKPCACEECMTPDED